MRLSLKMTQNKATEEWQVEAPTGGPPSGSRLSALPLAQRPRRPPHLAFLNHPYCACSGMLWRRFASCGLSWSSYRKEQYRIMPLSPEGGIDTTVSKGDDVTLPGTSKKRTRTGCLPCRRRRRKCDGARPGCRNCESWGFSGRLWMRQKTLSVATIFLMMCVLAPGSTVNSRTDKTGRTRGEWRHAMQLQ
ncbi:hypothetical protein BO94DRAFT_2217 [Aspergillus sclerotioniger CBS 115572]|uniref:Zn(2)-C6 fungal-type domain-containing protein n=1 Tax=Aspergillus sclerotioniger CBS 115572 TaxID=1450535 RepID=A0A317XCZ1_9EURO|nr:hypothetical protein BO94DRAFT_2217 [Aspergillus sclerotioniger CBS 115572]PWY96195.1 hypothetical protein BO94DRAFT_2217 [Aspergillus sclerotioniger CBS 115572]